MEYTGNYNYDDDIFFELKSNFSQDTYKYNSSNPSAAHTNSKAKELKKQFGFVISFSSTQEEEEEDIAAILSSENQSGGNKNIMYKRSPVQAQDHVIAERKRREKMGELFISLSKIVPGLKKLDKSSILGDTIEYMKELQERVKQLEESNKIPSALEHNGSGSSSKDQVLGSNKIKARILDNNVLINIHCTKQDRMMGRLLFQMEQLHLSVNDIRIMPFGPTNLEISILAEMKDGCCIKVEDIVKAFQINILDIVNN
ncbi:unnamed protein product [Withania somnifera]